MPAAAKTADAPNPEVFVSYARSNEAQVRKLVRELENNGVTVWRDGDQILGGQYYGEQIAHALAHSRVVLLMCSAEAFASDNVHRELLLTWDYYHRTFLPVWLGSPIEIPHRFRYCLAGCQWLAGENLEQAIPAMLMALESMGVTTRREVETARPPQPGTAPAVRRGPRFQPGDRPLASSDWQLTDLLGKGGFGEVWKAVNPELPSQAPVALKFALDLDDMGRKLLKHEAEMILRVQQIVKNEGVVPLLHAYLNNDPPCLEYPYFAGSTLVPIIEKRRQNPDSIPVAVVHTIMQRIAQIVGEFHRAAQPLVHCDLKPSNILTRRNADGKFTVHITDFGIGRVAAGASLERSRSHSSSEASMAAVLTGSHTPLYASPQQMKGLPPDARDDVYSIGVMWHQLLTGDVTSPAPTGRKWMAALKNQQVSVEAIDLLASCIEATSSDRPADCAALATKLAAISQPSKSRRPTPRPEGVIAAELADEEVAQVAMSSKPKLPESMRLDAAPKPSESKPSVPVAKLRDTWPPEAKPPAAAPQPPVAKPPTNRPPNPPQTSRPAAPPTAIPTDVFRPVNVSDAIKSSAKSPQPSQVKVHSQVWNPPRQTAPTGSLLRANYPWWPFLLYGFYLFICMNMVGLFILTGFAGGGLLAFGVALGVSIVGGVLSWIPIRILRGKTVTRLALFPGILIGALLFCAMSCLCVMATIDAFEHSKLLPTRWPTTVTNALKQLPMDLQSLLFYFTAAASSIVWLVSYSWLTWRREPLEVGLSLHRTLLKWCILYGLIALVVFLIDHRDERSLAGVAATASMLFTYTLAFLALGPALLLRVNRRCLEVRTADQYALAVDSTSTHPLWYFLVAVTIIMAAWVCLT